MAPFFSVARYTMGPLFSTKSIYEWPYFSRLVYERSHFSDIPLYVHIFRWEIFRGRLFSWYSRILELTAVDCDICLTTSNKWQQKDQRAVYKWVNISDDLVYEWVRFSEARYMNGVDFEILARTPVLQLSPSYPLSPILTPRIANTEPASVAQLDAPSDRRPGGRGFNPRRGRQHSFVEIDFLRSFSPFRWFKKGSCQFLAKECAQYWITA